MARRTPSLAQRVGLDARKGRTSPAKRVSVRGEYQQHGVEGYYRDLGTGYQNPHETRIRAALFLALERHPVAPSANVLDLCCGSGEITLALREKGFRHVEGADPFTREAYERRTGATPLPIDFVQLSDGALAERSYDLVVCSYALHLVPTSRLPGVIWQLSRSAPRLFVLSPHKRPRLRTEWGFSLIETLLCERVHVRVYQRPPITR
jgi:2-polyprenyl-3-methyl-5-hydroxy-6-metoxy-1,4-benzoquinol methylase